MKQEDVEIGGTYETYIGQQLCRVVVTGKRAGMPGRDTCYGRRNKERDTFFIRRENESRVLPKTRTAAALRKIGGTETLCAETS